MMENGAKSVRALCSHAIMRRSASERVDACSLVEMIFTNSIPYRKDCRKCTILSVARLSPTPSAVCTTTSPYPRSTSLNK